MSVALTNFLRLSDYIKRPSITVNNRRSCNADFGNDVAGKNVRRRPRRDSVRRIDKPRAPQQTYRAVVRVECIHAVMLRGDKHSVASSLAGNDHVWTVPRLRIIVTVD